MKIILILAACILAATAAAVALGIYALSRRIATGLSYWKLPEPDNIINTRSGNIITRKKCPPGKKDCERHDYLQGESL